MLELPVATAAPRSASFPALASLGVTSRLCGEPQPAVVMGASTGFAWCALQDDVVLLAPPHAVRFPNAILGHGGWDGLEPGDELYVGSGGVRGHTIDWRVVRWWDPTVAPIASRPDEVMARVSTFGPNGGPQTAALEAALATFDPDAVLEAAGEMLGSGTGLTPEGDDRLIGAVAAFRHVTSSLGRREGASMLDGLVDDLMAIASLRTTRLSVTLLRHALVDEVADPVGDLLRALTGAGVVATAVERCLDLGASSGSALVRGVTCGARAACAEAP